MGWRSEICDALHVHIMSFVVSRVSEEALDLWHTTTQQCCSSTHHRSDVMSTDDALIDSCGLWQHHHHHHHQGRDRPSSLPIVCSFREVVNRQETILDV